MCDICNAAGYEIEPECSECGTEAVGVWLDGSGCWECAPREGRLDATATARVLDAFSRRGASFFRN